MSRSFTSVQHPRSTKYLEDRRDQIKSCLSMSEPELKKLLKHMQQDTPIRDDHSMVGKIIGEMYSEPMLPNATKGILDSTSGTTGNVLIRQDLEPVLYALFVKRFPVFDRLRKVPANGLTLLAPAA